MNWPGLLLAQLEFPRELMVPPWQRLNAAAREFLSISGAATVVAISAVIWAVYFRKRRRRRSRHHIPERTDKSTSQVASNPEAVPRRKRRSRRKDHRPRNPTLAETGGLPPLRQDRPPEPFP